MFIYMTRRLKITNIVVITTGTLPVTGPSNRCVDYRVTAISRNKKYLNNDKAKKQSLLKLREGILLEPVMSTAVCVLGFQKRTHHSSFFKTWPTREAFHVKTIVPLGFGYFSTLVQVCLRLENSSIISTQVLEILEYYWPYLWKKYWICFHTNGLQNVV